MASLALVSGCYTSHFADGVGASDGAAPRDAGSLAGREGGVASADASVPPPPPGLDGGDLPPPPPPPPPPRRSWAERCMTLCPRLIECAADVPSADSCVRSCLSTEAVFVDPVCRELADAALDCLEGLGCADLEGLQPDETVCAPFFARFRARCPG